MKIKLLGEITVKIGSGATPSGGSNSYKASGISLIRSQNVHDFKFSKDGLAFINGEQAKKLNNVSVCEDDVLINITGDSIARTCMVPNEILPARVNQHVSIIRCKPEYNSKYVHYYLIHLKSHLFQICGVGGTRNALTKDALYKLPIKVSNQQNQIAKVLSDLDTKIELNNKINAELEAMAKTLYDYWFVQFDFPFDFAQDKPNENKTVAERSRVVAERSRVVAERSRVVAERSRGYKSSGGKMVWNEELKRDIPEGWEVKLVDELLSKETPSKKIPTSHYLEKGLIPIIDQSTNFIAGYTNDQNCIISCEVPRIIFGDHTRILKLINFNFARGADGTQVLLSNSKRNPQHLFYHSLLKIDLSNYGYARHFKFLKDSKIILPDEKIANKYEVIVKNFFDNIKTNSIQNQQLASLRDWLLPMLMNGQVRVGDVEEKLGMVAEPREVVKKGNYEGFI